MQMHHKTHTPPLHPMSQHHPGQGQIVPPQGLMTMSDPHAIGHHNMTTHYTMATTPHSAPMTPLHHPEMHYPQHLISGHPMSSGVSMHAPVSLHETMMHHALNSNP